MCIRDRPYENKIALARAHSSIIKNNFKLIKFRNNNELVLYDIDNDFMEAENLFEQYPELTDELESLLDGYLFKFKSLKWQNGINWKNVNVNKVNSFYE